jgi:hypothetical protein
VAAADTYVSSAYATTNYGTTSGMASDSSPTERAYVRFTVGSYSGAIVSAKLRLYVRNGSDAAS